MKNVFKKLAVIFFGLTLSHQGLAETIKPSVSPRLVIIIDDMGNNYIEGKKVLDLPGELTYSFLPHTQHTNALLDIASQRGKEVMLHVPMESRGQAKLGPGSLTSQMSEAEFKAVLNKALDSIPTVIGMNNHMGSLLTTLNQPMHWVMDVMGDRGLFFVDSRTIPNSVAWKTAEERGIPYLKRDIFLDHKRDWAFMSNQLTRAVNIAKKFGSAVMIGHPYPSTAKFLESELPKLAGRGVILVSASTLILEDG